jgi:hypothetical protein
MHFIGTGTRDLPACSIVPQPTTLPRAPSPAYSTLFNPQTFTYRSQLSDQDDIIIHKNILDSRSIVSSLSGVRFVTACIEVTSVWYIN